MSDEYVPETAEVRDAYAAARWEAYGSDVSTVKSDTNAACRAFDRWLAAHDAQIAISALRAAAIDAAILPAKVDAWDEGFDAGERDAMGHETFDEPCIPNPYRAAIKQ